MRPYFLSDLIWVQTIFKDDRQTSLAGKKFRGNIRIYHECEGRKEKSIPRDHRLASLGKSKIEKSVPRIAVWHHEACRVMTNGDPEGRIFLSYLHTNNGFFFLLTTVFIY